MAQQATTQKPTEEDTIMQDEQTQSKDTKDNPNHTSDNTSNNKRKNKIAKTPHLPPSTQTLHPTHTYLHLSLVRTLPATATTALDPTTARGHLLVALSQYLGDHGAAIPVDILHIEKQDVYVRVPVQDGSAVVAALSGWSGVGGGAGVAWRVKARCEWLSVLVGEGGNDGQALFEFVR